LSAHGGSEEEKDYFLRREVKETWILLQEVNKVLN